MLNSKEVMNVGSRLLEEKGIEPHLVNEGKDYLDRESLENMLRFYKELYTCFNKVVDCVSDFNISGATLHISRGLCTLSEAINYYGENFIAPLEGGIERELEIHNTIPHIYDAELLDICLTYRNEFPFGLDNILTLLMRGCDLPDEEGKISDMFFFINTMIMEIFDLDRRCPQLNLSDIFKKVSEDPDNYMNVTPNVDIQYFMNKVR